MLKDFHKFCRFCLGSNCELVDISTTDDSENSMSVIDMVDYIMGKECLQDAFAKKSCLTCLKAMEQSCEFKAMCEQSLDYVYDHLKKELGMTEVEPEMEVEVIPEIEQVVIGDNYTIVDPIENDESTIFNPLEINPDDAFISNEKQIENIQKTATRKRKQEMAVLKDADNKKETEKVAKERKLIVKLVRIDDYILKQLREKKSIDTSKNNIIQTTATPYTSPPKLKVPRPRRPSVKPSVPSPRQNQAYQCFECGKIMKSESFFEKHLGIHPNVQQCGDCQKFKTIKRIEGDNKYVCRCQLTKMMFTMTTNEVRILTDKDREIRMPYCPVCRKIVKDAGMLERHRQWHADPGIADADKASLPGVTVECPVCKKKSTTVQEFMDHLRSHSGERKSVA